MSIFLTSIPKAGTNLVQKLFHLLGVNYSGRSIGASSCAGRYAYVKKLLRGPMRKEIPVIVGLEVPVGVSPSWLRRWLKNPDGYVSAHAPFSESLYAILQEYDYKIVVVVRHPAAIISSWARYIVEDSYYLKSIRDYCRRMSEQDRVRFLLHGGYIEGVGYYPCFAEILDRMMPWIIRDDVFVVRFEDLVGSRGGGDDEKQAETVSSIVRFLGLVKSAEELREVRKNLYGGTHTFRIGQVDAWKERLPSELKREISDRLVDHAFLKTFGYRI